MIPATWPPGRTTTRKPRASGDDPAFNTIKSADYA